MELDLKDRRKLTAVTARKYRTAEKKKKTKILDTFIEQTGFNRKYAIHILAVEKDKCVNHRPAAETKQEKVENKRDLRHKAGSQASKKSDSYSQPF